MSQDLMAALIGFTGVAIGSLIQWLSTRYSMSAESERLRHQLTVEFEQRQFSEWQSRFQSAMADLLAAVDPESSPIPDKKVIVPLVLKVQLMLNVNVETHGKVNELVNRLALAVTGWHGKKNVAEIYEMQGALLDAAKKTMYLPGHSREKV